VGTIILAILVCACIQCVICTFSYYMDVIYSYGTGAIPAIECVPIGYLRKDCSYMVEHLKFTVHIRYDLLVV
jgi:hypothetical protein